MAGQLLVILLCFVSALAVGQGKQQRGENPCGAGKLPCEDKQCIDESQWCDKTEDCSDGSDEKFCVEDTFWKSGSSKKCPKDKYFGCKNGQCIPLVAVCDGKLHCQDDSDEKTELCAESTEDKTETKARESQAGSLEPGEIPSANLTESTELLEDPESEDGFKLDESEKGRDDALFDPDPPSKEQDSSKETNRSQTDSDESDDFGPEKFGGSLPSPAPTSTTTTLQPPAQVTSASTPKSQASIAFPSPSPPPASTISATTRRTSLPPRRAKTNGPVKSPITTVRTSGSSTTVRPYTRPTSTSFYDRRASEAAARNRHVNRRSNQAPQPDRLRYNPQNAGNGYNPGPKTYPPQNGQGSSHHERDTAQHWGHHSTHSSVPGIDYEVHPPPPLPNGYGFGNRFSPYGKPPGIITPTSHQNPQPSNGNHPRLVRVSRRFVCHPVQRNAANGPIWYQLDSHVARHAHERPSIKLPPFYFRNYVGYNTRDKYADVLNRARHWILQQQDGSYDWGQDTPRAVVALSLINNSFLPADQDGDMIKKALATHLGIKLIKESMSDSTLASYINALVATCQDPNQFMGRNLTEMLLDRTRNNIVVNSSINPVVDISLCLAGAPVDHYRMRKLIDLLYAHTEDEGEMDRQILATMALACMQQTERYKDYMTKILQTAVEQLIRRRHQEGERFGGLYRTALAAQALLSTNVSDPWAVDETLRFLAGYQREDGSFGDMLATYLTIPVLSGRNLLYLRNTQCEENPPPSPTFEDSFRVPGPKKQILLTLNVDNPPTTTNYISLSIPRNFSLLEAMKVAEHLNPQFRFEYELTSDFLYVYTISGISNDPERGYRWRLFVVNEDPNATPLDLRQDMEREDLHKLIPRDCDELIFWYLRDF